MTNAKAGDTVHIKYTGTLADGQVFDSSDGREPLKFVVGSGQIIPGLDVAIPGMAVGDKKTVDVPCAQAYGARNENAQHAIPRSEVPDDIPLQLGAQLQLQTPQGQTIPVTVVDLNADEVVLDANHSLAGQDLTFAIEVVRIDAV